MQEIISNLTNLKAELEKALERLKIDELRKELDDLQKQSQSSDFWGDRSSAQQVMKRQARLQSQIAPWQELKAKTDEALELAKMEDTSMLSELEKQYLNLQKTFAKQKKELRFNAPYDNHDVILSIRAGAGGVDAQDWSSMLLRMYVRWAEKRGFKIDTVDQSSGEESGIKSATIEISGSYAYGWLKSEHGVHRLVRLSPFNADNLRQTSFAKVDVLPKIEQDDSLEISDKDLKVDVFRAGGHGGQSVNTTDSAVRITHLPTSITVTIQNERSQLQNKETAMTILRSRLTQLQIEQHNKEVKSLKGPNLSAEWGNQIRSYVLHPYKQVKDLRTRHETSDIDAVLDGNLDPFMEAYLEASIGL